MVYQSLIGEFQESFGDCKPFSKEVFGECVSFIWRILIIVVLGKSKEMNWETRLKKSSVMLNNQNRKKTIHQ